MNNDFPQIRVMGERAILIEFPAEISENMLLELLFLKNKIQQNYTKQKVEVINTYASLLIYYCYDIENVYSEVLAIKRLIGEANIDKKVNSKLFYIPVCYDSEFGIDLEYISTEKKLNVEEIISLHTATLYTVYFIGFLPGFLYLGGLDKKLQISRKITPRLRVEKGAVGIGENQTGIYPKSSPGGWQIIGNSPIQIFDKNSNPPCRISAGDKIKFYSVSRPEFDSIKSVVNEGNFQLREERNDS